MVVRHLPKAVSRISSLLLRRGGRTTQEVEELQVLSNGIILKLISSLKNRLINFCGFIHPRKFFNDENFPGYGI